MSYLTNLCALIITGGAVAVPMPDPADYVGKQIIQIDVPDEATVNLLLAEGLNGLACRPAPGVGPWLVDTETRTFVESLG